MADFWNFLLNIFGAMVDHRLTKTAKSKSANKGGLLYLLFD